MFTTVARLIPTRFSSCFNFFVVMRIFKDHVNFMHVSGAQNPVHRLKVTEFLTSEFYLRDF